MSVGPVKSPHHKLGTFQSEFQVHIKMGPISQYEIKATDNSKQLEFYMKCPIWYKWVTHKFTEKISYLQKITTSSKIILYTVIYNEV